MAIPSLDRETILRVVRSWSPDEQVTLAREILEGVGTPTVQEPLDPPNSHGLAGLFATGAQPPTDEDVARWLDERRLEKYGG